MEGHLPDTVSDLRVFKAIEILFLIYFWYMAQFLVNYLFKSRLKFSGLDYSG